MAGVKGRSGGSRPNTGGARPGAGRKRKVPVPVLNVITVPSPVAKAKPKFAAQPAPKPVVAPVAKPEPAPAVSPPAQVIPTLTPEEAAACRDDPLEFLRAVWSGRQDASPTQIRAAAAALPFLHKKLGEGGKKDQVQKAAEKVASRFAPVAAPKLVASNGRS